MQYSQLGDSYSLYESHVTLICGDCRKSEVFKELDQALVFFDLCANFLLCIRNLHSFQTIYHILQGTK